MTSLNRDRVVTNFRKVKDLTTKTLTFDAWVRKVNVNPMFFNKKDIFFFLINIFKILGLRLLFTRKRQKLGFSQ